MSWSTGNIRGLNIFRPTYNWNTVITFN